MSLRRPLVAFVGAAIFMLAAMAYATEIDPGWGGLYDNDDGDNVILFITVTMASVEPPTITRIDQTPVIVGKVADHQVAEPVRVSVSLPDSRSPPSL